MGNLLYVLSFYGSRLYRHTVQSVPVSQKVPGRDGHRVHRTDIHFGSYLRVPRDPREGVTDFFRRELDYLKFLWTPISLDLGSSESLSLIPRGWSWNTWLSPPSYSVLHSTSTEVLSVVSPCLWSRNVRTGGLICTGTFFHYPLDLNGLSLRQGGESPYPRVVHLISLISFCKFQRKQYVGL